MPPLSPFNKSCLAVGQLISMSSHSATITVNSNTDDGVGCTLREAIVSANTTVNQNNDCVVGSNGGTDTIVFSNDLASNTIVLSDESLLVGIRQDIEINASQIDGGITIDGNSQGNSVLVVERVDSLVLNNLTITNGGRPTFRGGAIDVSVGNNSRRSDQSQITNLSLIDSVVTGNIGSGIFANVRGDFRAFGSRYDNALLNLSLTNSTVSDNSSTSNRSSISGISVNSRFSIVNLLLTNSTVSNNISSDSSLSANNISVITDVGYSNITLTNSTVSGSPASDSSGIYLNSRIVSSNSYNVGSTNILTLNNSTVSGSSSGSTAAGLSLVNGGSSEYFDSITDVNINNSIIANFNGDCVIQGLYGTSVTVDSATIIEDGSCGANRSGDPGLLDLNDNGGLTQTHALSESSIARNSSVGTCELTDQLEQVRDISDGFCDVGAVEFNPDFLIAPEETTNFVIPLPNGNTVIFDL